MFIELLIPIKIASTANIREHWTQSYKRRKLQKLLITTKWHGEKVLPPLPCKVTFIRVGPRLLDEDNLMYALKTCRDCVCDLITPGLAPGRADANEKITIEYKQEKSKNKFYALKIRIEDG